MRVLTCFTKTKCLCNEEYNSLNTTTLLLLLFYMNRLIKYMMVLPEVKDSGVIVPRSDLRVGTTSRRITSKEKLPPSWCHWRTDDWGERNRKKKNTAPRWLEKQEKILGAKGGRWRSKKMETTVYQSNISIFHESLDLLISRILTNNYVVIINRHI